LTVLRVIKHHPLDTAFTAPFPTLLKGRADIEGSKSNVAMNAWLPQASYPCGTVDPCTAVSHALKGSRLVKPFIP
jgi:hypothetical protein